MQEKSHVSRFFCVLRSPLNIPVNTSEDIICMLLIHKQRKVSQTIISNDQI